MFHTFEVKHNSVEGISAIQMNTGQFGLLTSGLYKGKPVLKSVADVIVLTDPTVTSYKVEFDTVEVLKEGAQLTITTAGQEKEKPMKDKWAQSMLQPMYVISEVTGETIASVAEFDESGKVTLYYGGISREEAGKRARVIAALPALVNLLRRYTSNDAPRGGYDELTSETENLLESLNLG